MEAFAVWRVFVVPSELTGFAAPKATVLGLAQQKALGMFATAHSKEAEQVYSADPELGGVVFANWRSSRSQPPDDFKRLPQQWSQCNSLI